MDFVTFLHCEACSLRFDPNSCNLCLSSCLHISCKGCVKRLPDGGHQCHCGKNAGFMPINSKMPSDYKLLVVKHGEIIKSISGAQKKLSEQMAALRKASEFQTRIHSQWTSALQKKVSDQRKEIQSLREQVQKYRESNSQAQSGHVQNHHQAVNHHQDVSRHQTQSHPHTMNYPQGVNHQKAQNHQNAASRYSMATVNNFVNQAVATSSNQARTQDPLQLPLDRNVELKTPLNNGSLNKAFVPPFPSKKSTPGSGPQTLSMKELLSTKPAATPINQWGSGGSNPRRLTMTYAQSRIPFWHTTPSSTEAKTFNKRRNN